MERPSLRRSPDAGVRLGIFGGSFDPPHIGHLLTAGDAAERLRFDRVVFIPAAVQPLKAGRAYASAEHRLEMTRLMVAGDERFEVSDVEVQRPGLSFTVDTLTHFAAIEPGADRYLLLGADAFALFRQWREPERVMQLARIAILERAGDSSPALPESVDVSRVERLRTRRIDISSTEIRERVRLGKSIRGFVTENVAEYVGRHRLYR